MNKFPEIKFVVDKEFEKEVALFFFEKYPEDFFERFIIDYPELKDVKTKEELFSKIDEYYLEKENLLFGRIKDIKNKWKDIQEDYFKEIAELFSFKWPSGEYTACISLFGMFRLVPGSKKFSIPFRDDIIGKKNWINATIAHEMLHIFFENYYSYYFKDQLELKKYYDLLELINAFVLNLDSIKNIVGWKSNVYTEHKKYYSDLKSSFENRKDMKEFVGGCVEYLGGVES